MSFSFSSPVLLSIHPQATATAAPAQGMYFIFRAHFSLKNVAYVSHRLFPHFALPHFFFASSNFNLLLVCLVAVFCPLIRAAQRITYGTGTRPGWRSHGSWSRGATSVPRGSNSSTTLGITSNGPWESGWWQDFTWPFSPSKPSMPTERTTKCTLTSAPKFSSPCSNSLPPGADSSPPSARSTLSTAPRDSGSSAETGAIFQPSSLASLLSSSSSPSPCPSVLDDSEKECEPSGPQHVAGVCDGSSVETHDGIRQRKPVAMR